MEGRLSKDFNYLSCLKSLLKKSVNGGLIPGHELIPNSHDWEIRVGCWRYQSSDFRVGDSVLKLLVLN